MRDQRFSTLISTGELAQQINSNQWIVFDCRFTLTDTDAGRSAFQFDHIVGAQYVHLEEDLSSPIRPGTGRHPLPDAYELSKKLGLWGVDSSDQAQQVVVYDDNFGAMASRMWWILKWLGYANVAVLDGGYAKWKRESLAIDKVVISREKKKFNPRLNNNLLIFSDFLQKSLSQNTQQGKKLLIMDARAEDRFAGEHEPLDKVAGHIPGAINHPFKKNLDITGCFLTPIELRAIYQDLATDVQPDHIVHMCGSGVTACHNVLAMEHAELSGSKLYIGSWSEWITDSKRPVSK